MLLLCDVLGSKLSESKGLLLQGVRRAALGWSDGGHKDVNIILGLGLARLAPAALLLLLGSCAPCAGGSSPSATLRSSSSYSFSPSS
eukprot:4872264-Pleurochrysis_carterae.AAC.1